MYYDLVKIKGKVTFCHHLFTLMVFQTYDFFAFAEHKYFLFFFECTIPLTFMFTRFSPQKSTKINLTRVFCRVLEEISSASHNVVMFAKIKEPAIKG